MPRRMTGYRDSPTRGSACPRNRGTRACVLPADAGVSRHEHFPCAIHTKGFLHEEAFAMVLLAFELDLKSRAEDGQGVVVVAQCQALPTRPVPGA